MKLERVIISGGGTGGHVFPAIAIADEIKRKNPAVSILFVGAIGKMEMDKVPAAGYNIVGLPIVGFQRKLTLSNFLLPFKLINSLIKAYLVIKRFKPQVVIGVGGYASGPTLKIATLLNIPTVIQEQNSFPGKTNKLLARKVSAICTAYTGLEQFFPKDKITLTGNPIRKEMVEIEGKKEAALAYYGLESAKKTVLVIGGSLGARTLNNALLKDLHLLKEKGIIDFIKLINSSDINYQLKVYGLDYSNHFKNTKRIKYFPQIYNIKKIIDVYDACNIFILPSYTESAPKVIWESLSRLRPVIVFKDIRHVAYKKKGVYICERNVTSLSRKINFIKKNYQNIQKKIKKNKFPTKNEFQNNLLNIIKRDEFSPKKI
jgi:UDP-N-acetylglucosamine:LPS N-acetylglucosamine transferase